MDAVWHAIAKVFEFIFTFLPGGLGNLVNWFFGISITIGVVFWLWYDAKVRRGADNFMAKPGGQK